MAGSVKSRIKDQIIVAVVLAILIGSSSPWWWGEIKEYFSSGEKIQEAVNSIQGLYSQHKLLNTCEDANRLVRELAPYLKNRSALPEGMSKTIKYPFPPENIPTISDLAKDRMIRIKRVMSQCFPEGLGPY